MIEYTNKEILAYRKTWIEFLKNPETKKGTGALDANGDGHRCCLGHACYILGLTPIPLGTGKFAYGALQEIYYAPDEIMEKLGLWNKSGHSKNYEPLFLTEKYQAVSLASGNDDTYITPQEIGQYLERNIMGGEDTPFKPIND